MSVLVGKRAPDFTASAVMADNSIKHNFKLSTYLEDAYGLIFFYPMDFTFVCPSEIIAFQNRNTAFQAHGARLVAISVDSEHSHYAWRNTPVEKGGLGQIDFPLVADITKQIARDYDVLINSAVALRGLFLIDRDFVVRHQLVNDLPLGRNADEALRMVQALQYFETEGEVCPAGWTQGERGIEPTTEGVAAFLSEKADQL
ncbi:MAG: peroxiredoxin [Rhodothalassiaceae bacterium]